MPIKINCLQKNERKSGRNIIAHHFFISLTPIISIIEGNIPEGHVQVTEYRLDLEMLPRDKDFDKKRDEFIRKFGPSVNALSLCSDFFKELSAFIKEAEHDYGNKQHYLKSKVKSKFRVNKDLTLSHYERSY